MTEHTSPMRDTSRARLRGRASRMVDAGRLTADEARRLQAATDPDEFDSVVLDIRTRHAVATLEAAVAEGALSPERAADLLHRLRGGEDPATLRDELRRLGVRHGFGAPTPRTSPGGGDAHRPLPGE